MRIIPLSEGSFTIDKTKLFVPFDEASDQLHQRPAGSLLVEIQPFVLITARDVILLDTGLGFEKEGELQLHHNMKAAGIMPADITKVLLSHLHKDHAGAVGLEREGLGSRLSLPNALYFIQRQELSHAFEKGFPSYITSELECLRNNSQVVLLEGDGMLDGYIQYKVTGAHSLWHQVFWIRDGEFTIFFGGDDAPQLHQMKHRFAAKYDYDGKKAMELRQQWWQEGHEEKWTFLFYHDIKSPVYPQP
jgi:glyoxylase-like metal-dependent hydrolase (beta-lactamase superfamily II)